MMDMLEPGLEPSHEKEDPDAEEHITLATDDATDEQAAAIASVAGTGGLTLDPNMQFQLRADGNSQGQVTYRVVQLSNDGETTAQVVASNFPPNQVTVIQSPFSNGGSPTPEQQGDARFAYFSAAGGTEGAGVSAQGETLTAATALTPVAAGAGQFYVMMSPQDVLQNPQRTIAPRTSYSPKLEGRSSRDDRRRATHNEVERRRRDKINNWIVQLSKLVPDCVQETKPNQASKGGILSKACEYIQELRGSNKTLMETVKETERMSVDMELYRSQMEELKRQNESLRALLINNNIAIPPNLLPDLV
ncbi:upstream stimulatory factor 2-like [Babylonia areolata]|uniref:upstream stimulatory factor 2-like n=1 Tax=Babylonia areolata TaxID=304850 RepID=UPI003FD02871